MNIGCRPKKLNDAAQRRARSTDELASDAKRTLALSITCKSGDTFEVPVKCRIDTDDESEMFAAGGLLPRIGQEPGVAA